MRTAETAFIWQRSEDGWTDIVEQLAPMEAGACHQYLGGPRDDVQVMASIGEYGEDWWNRHPTTYFPGVGRRDARVVEVGEGERKTGFTIVVTPLSETTVSGVVVFDDDRPVVEANVTAAPNDQRGLIMGSARADSSGAFELRLLAGVSYLVRAGIRTENGFRQTETVVFVDQRLDSLRLSIAR